MSCSYLSLFPLSPLVSCHHHPFREKKQRETREAVGAHSAGLGHPDEETQQSIRNCKETETDFFHFHPCVSLTGQRDKTPAMHKELQKICDWIRMFA